MARLMLMIAFQITGVVFLGIGFAIGFAAGKEDKQIPTG